MIKIHNNNLKYFNNKKKKKINKNKKNFQLKYRLYGHTDAISNMYWSPDGTQLLTCSNDKTIKLWDIIVSFSLLISFYIYILYD